MYSIFLHKCNSQLTQEELYTYKLLHIKFLPKLEETFLFFLSLFGRNFSSKISRNKKKKTIKIKYILSNLLPKPQRT